MDLWPQGLIENYDAIDTPKSILDEQGDLLGEKTNNLVVGKMYSYEPNSFNYVSEQFNYIFSITAPTIKYSYDLIKISHDISFYPLNIEFEGTEQVAGNQDEFISHLREIFASPKTKMIVTGLLALLDFRQPRSDSLRSSRNEDIPF